MRLIATAAVIAFLGSSATAAAAALTKVTNPADLPAGLTFSTDFDDVVAGPIPSLVVAAGTSGEAQVGADGGLFSSGAGVVSQAFDMEPTGAFLPITFTFAQPVQGLGITGGIVDESFAGISGTLGLTVGTETVEFDLGPTAAFAGILSDTLFTQASVAVVRFDADASSVAFVGLEGATSVVPIPAAAPLLATALLGLAVLHRRRSSSAT
jgi:hypothetical protein